MRNVNLKGIWIGIYLISVLTMYGQSGPGGVRDNTSNIFWLKGNVGLFDASGKVGKWEDQASSNDADTLTGQAPVYNETLFNSLPGVDFESGDILQIANSGSINTASFTARTIFIAFRTPSSFAGNEVLYEQGDSNDGMIFYVDGSGQLNAGIYNTTNDYFVQSSALTVSTDYIFAFTFDGGATTINGYINNTSFGTNSSTAGSVIGNTGDISLGDSGDGNQINGGGTVSAGSASFTGEMAEVVYFDVVLNDAEITIINNYLGEKYAIAQTSNDRYSETNYSSDVTGIGRQTAGNTHTTSTGSGGELYLDESGSTLDADDEWVFAGHNGTSHGTTKNDVDAGLSGFSRWSRVWYIEKTTSGAIDVTLSFDTDEAGFGLASTIGLTTDFKLLYTTDPSTVDFNEVSGTPAASFTDGDAKVTFTLTNANFSDGYYTLGVTEIVSFYSYSTGDWDDPNNWTTDPSGTIRTNPDNRYPNQSTDNVFILNGDEIDLDADAVTSNGGAFTIGDVTINSGGIIDLEGTSGHTFENFSGIGTLKMQGDNYPTVNTTDDFISSTGGTVELNGSSAYDFNAGKTTYNNLTINLTATTVTLRDTLTLNGDFLVSSGTFQINDNSDTDLIKMTVNGDITVESGGSLTVGTADASFDRSGETNVTDIFVFHQLELKGNFTNEGSVALTNITDSDGDITNNRYLENYATAADPENSGNGFPINEYGVVELLMTNTTADQTVTCNGSCTFYRIEVAKGTDDTYICEINASSTSNFNIYGRVAFQQYFGTANTSLYENPRALGLESGTLKLGNNVVVPEICANDPGGGTDARVCDGTNCNSDFVIYPSARLWLAGTSSVTSSDQEGIHVMGKLQVSDDAQLSKGTLQGRGKCDIIFDDEAAVEIQGGTVTVSQIRTKENGVLPRGSWTHTGGTVTANPYSAIGDGGLTTHAIFSMPFEDMSFVMSASDPANPPVLILENEDSGNDGPKEDASGARDVFVQIGIKEGNYSVTEGTVIVRIKANDHAVINSTIPFWNLTFDKDNTINQEHTLNDVPASGTIPAQTIQPLVVLNDFRMLDNGCACSDNFRVRYDGRTEDMQVGNGFFLENDTYFETDATTLEFNGTSAVQRISIEGTLQSNGGSGFYNLLLTGSGTKRIEGTLDPVIVGNDLTISDGVILDDNGFAIEVVGDITNSGSHTGNGKIELTGGASAHTLSGDDTGIFANLELDDTNGANFTADFSVIDTLTMTTGILDIDIYGLTLDSDSSGISGTGYSTTKYIRTAGNASDEGISMYIANDRDDYLFPIGTDKESATDKYTPMELSISGANGIDSGYVKLSVGDQVLPTIDPSETAKLSYYWRVNHSGFSTLPSHSLRMYYDQSDVTGNENQYNGGRVLDEVPFTRTEENANDDDGGTNELVFNSSGSNNGAFPGNRFTIENANYSAAGSNAWNGAPEVYYSRVANDTWTNWNLNSTWSTTGHTGAAASDYPQAGDIAIIGSTYTGGGTGRHQIFTDADVAVASLVFDSQSGSNPLDVSSLSRLRVDRTYTATLDQVSGKGELVPRVSNNGTQSEGTITGDLGDFVENDSSGFMYWIVATTNTRITISDRSEFPGLRVFGGSQNAELTFGNNITANSILIDNTADLVVTNDFDISGVAKFGDNGAGYLSFESLGTNETFACDSLVFNNASGTISVENAGTDEHVLRVDGSIDLSTMSSMNLYNSGATSVILQFGGTSDDTFENTAGITPELYRIVVDKGTDRTSDISIDTDFNLNGTTSGTTKAIEITNGTLILNNSGIDVTLNSGSGDFTIPSTGGLTITQGIARVTATGTGSGNGVRLDGKLTINGGDAIFTDGANGDNYIEYGTGGSSEIELTSGNLFVGSQLRRSLLSSTGNLTYNQTGGVALFGVNTGATFDDSRGVFELTDGSFTLDIASPSEVFALVDAQANPGDGTFILGSSITSPTVSLSAGSYIDFGYNDGTYVTTGSPTFELNTYFELSNIRIDSLNAGSPSVQVVVNPLDLSNNVKIHNSGTLDANGLQLNIGGDFENNGTFTSNSNQTIFDGTTQSISGSTSTGFYDLTISSSGEVGTSATLTVNNDFNITSGSFNDNGNALSVKGNVDVQTTYSGSGGLTMNSGSVAQEISAADQTGTISKLVVDNSNGVSLTETAGNQVVTLTISSEMAVNNGVFLIGDNRLVVQAAANITTTGSFDENTMIAVNGVKKSDGIEKEFTGASPSAVNFTIPIGVPGKYTPIDISVITSESASILFKAINSPHPSATGSEVLDYYWVVTSSDDDLTDFDNGSSITLTYTGSDVNGNINNYANARLVVPNWQKLSPPISGNGINSANNTITWTNADLNTNSFTGEYTIGEAADIPDELVIFRSVTAASGPWATVANWEYSTDGGSNFNPAVSVPTAGSQIIIQSGTTINMATPGDNDQNVFSVDIDGVLNINATDGHNFGDISGSGTMQLESGTLPGGNFDAFFTTLAGTLEFAGAGSYTLPADFTNIKGIVVSGGGTKTIPAIDYNIGTDGIDIQGGTILDNGNNSNITSTGAITLTNGTFNAGNSSASISAADFTLTAGTFNGESSGISLSGTLNIDGGTFTSTTGTLSLTGDIDYTGGTFSNNNGNILFTGTTNQFVNGDFSTNKFYNAEINKSSGQVFIGNSDTIAIQNTLTLTDGRFNTADSTDAALLLCEVVSINKGSYVPGSGFINGPILVELDNGVDFEFPVGKGTVSKPLDINTTSGQTGVIVWEVEYYPLSAVANEGTVTDFDIETGSPVQLMNDQEYWRVNTGAESATIASLTLDISNSVNQSEIDDQEIHVMVWDVVGDEWDDLAGASSGTGSNASITSASGTSFSEKFFTIGSENSGSLLPVELVSFEGNVVDDIVELSWKTATEINNDYFEIQRSIDGFTFEAMGEVDGFGTTSELIEYLFVDNSPIRGINYYRLKQFDFDGQYEIHETIAVNYDRAISDVEYTIFPNPATSENLNLRLRYVEDQNPIHLQIMDVSGRIFHYQQLSARNGDHKLDVAGSLPKGVYFLNMVQNDQKHVIRFVIAR